MSERTITCKDCSAAFTTSDTRRVYCDACSPQHSRNRAAANPVVKTCAVCGNTFPDASPGRRRRFCSHTCAALAQHHTEHTNCHACAQLAYCRSILFDVRDGPYGLEITPLPCSADGKRLARTQHPVQQIDLTEARP